MTESTNNTRNNYPILLEVKHVQQILGVGKRHAYDLVNMTEAKILRNKPHEFHVMRIGKLFKINRDSFFDWIEGKNGKQGA